MAFSMFQQSKLLQIAPEIREIIYGYLFKDSSRKVYYYCCPDQVKILPGLPTQVLRVCRQLNGETSGMVEESLTCTQLKFECDGTIPSRRMATPNQYTFLSKYGQYIKKIKLDECDEDSIDIPQVLRQCTGLTKLTVTCDFCELELDDVADKADEWWLGDPRVPEWTWELFEESGYWEEDSIWNALTRTKKGADRAYEIEFILRYDMRGASKNLWMAFDLDTKTAHRRWFEHHGKDPEAPQ